MAGANDSNRVRDVRRSLKAFQDNVTRSGSAAGAGYTLIGGIAFCGGVGYAPASRGGASPRVFLGGPVLRGLVRVLEAAEDALAPWGGGGGGGGRGGARGPCA